MKQVTVGPDVIDVHRHVNNQDYLHWMQEAAIEHSARQGWPMERYLASGRSWYVRSHYIEYLRPGLLDDEITVCTWIAGMAEFSSPRRTLFLRRSDHEILARAETQWIFVDLRRGRPVPIPSDLRDAFPIIESEEEPSCGSWRIRQGGLGLLPRAVRGRRSGLTCTHSAPAWAGGRHDRAIRGPGCSVRSSSAACAGSCEDASWPGAWRPLRVGKRARRGRG